MVNAFTLPLVSLRAASEAQMTKWKISFRNLCALFSLIGDASWAEEIIFKDDELGIIKLHTDGTYWNSATFDLVALLEFDRSQQQLGRIRLCDP